MLISRSKRLATVPLFAIVILIYLYHSPTERYVVATTRPQYDVTSKSQSHSPSNAAPSPLIDSNANANTNANINAVPKTNVTHDPAPQHKNTSQVPTAPPRIRQVTMVLDNGGSEQEMYERALETHYAHGERWGYSTHVLQQDIVGSEDGNVSRAGQWKTGVFKKPLYLLSLVVAELAKPEEERAEWIA